MESPRERTARSGREPRDRAASRDFELPTPLCAEALARYARKEKIDHFDLVEAVRSAQKGLVDADIGGGMIKQRVARNGKGKRGGYRVLIAIRFEDIAVFISGFAKNQKENIGGDELNVLKVIAASWFAATAEVIARSLEDGTLEELKIET